MIKFENTVNVIARRCFNTDVAIFLIKGCRDKESLFTRAACFRGLPRLRLAMTFRTLAFALVLSLVAVSELRAETTCAWEKDTNGNDTTKLVVSGSGLFIPSDCPNDYKSTVTELVIEEGVTDIKGSRVFQSQSLAKVTLPSTLRGIPDAAFIGTSNLSSIIIPEGVTSIASGAFWGSGLTSITLPKSITKISNQVFQGATSLANITIPDTVTYIGNLPFFGTKSLTEINCLNTKGQCGALQDLLGSILSGKSFNVVEPTENCVSYNAKGCIDCMATYSLSEGLCWAPWNKKHYTPAEAIKWLNDDNNTITITFKK